MDVCHFQHLRQCYILNSKVYLCILPLPARLLCVVPNIHQFNGVSWNARLMVGLPVNGACHSVTVHRSHAIQVEFCSAMSFSYWLDDLHTFEPRL